jgi:hypothetical protein
MDKSSVFIGSSSEGLDFARGVRAQLENDAEVTLWDEDFFGIGSTFIETLVNALPRFDFAILILTSDDLINSRNEENFGPRDNVIFELGLFMGRLGRERTFFIHQSNAAVKIPTDLSGVTSATYQWPRLTDKSHKAAVGSACDKIRRAIYDLGISEHKSLKRIDEFAQEQKRQSSQIDEITKMLVRLVITEHERKFLQGLIGQDPFVVKVSVRVAQQLEIEIRRLIALRLVNRQSERTVREFFAQWGKKDAKEYFFITDNGREYLRLMQSQGDWMAVTD